MASMTLPQSLFSHERASERTPVRVTHVVFDFNGGGMESLVADMAARFRGSPVQVSLITLSGRVGRLGSRTRDRFESFHVIRPLPVASMALPRGVIRAIRATKADVVHVHTGSWYKGARAARLAGARRVIYTEHGREHDDPSLKQWIDRRAARLTDAVVAVSSRLSRYMNAEVGIPSEKICTIHNGIDTSVFTPGPSRDELRASLSIPKDALVVGSVGRLESVKGYDTLLDAVTILRKQWMQPFVLVLFGDGNQREALQAQAAQLGIADGVRFAGWTSQPVDSYRLLDVFVLPSRSEGQSVSLMEAMSCGIAPVVTEVGANAEMIGSEFPENIVTPDRPLDLASAIMNAALSRERMKHVGAVMRSRVVESYSLEQMLERYERLYRGPSPLLQT